MFTLINARLSFIENSSILDNFFSDTTKKYAKIVGVALTIITAFSALYVAYRCYKEREIESVDEDDSSIPSHIKPVDPYKKDPSPKKPDPIEESPKKKKLNPIIEDSPENSPSSPKIDDEEYARKLQEQLLQEEMDDEDFARKLQHRYDDDEKKKKPSTPFKPPVHIDPHPITPTIKIKEPEKVDEIESPEVSPKSTLSNPFTQIDSICGEISQKTFTDSSFSAVKAIAKIDHKMEQEILGLLNEVVTEFERRFPVSRKIGYRQQVPAYFANVKEQSDSDRKYLSLVGIRNLLACGPSIIDDFRDQKYLGGEDNYAPMKGLKAFKYYTGNLVDLDTEIDAKSDHDALKMAEKMIVDFGITCGITTSSGRLTAADVARALPKRKLNLPNLNGYEQVYTSIGNTDRSLHGLWKRPPVSFGGQTHYYVNVPNCDIAVLATLRLPYMMAELIYLTKEYKHGKLMNEFYTTLFDKGLSDKCFNDKARAFITFYHEWKAKLEEVPSPKEEALQKLKKGLFGDELSKKNPDDVISGAFDRNKLMDLLTDFSDFGKADGYDKKGRSFEEWMRDVEAPSLKFLQERNIWKNALYQAEKDKDYFLVNESTLKEVLRNLYDYMY